MVRYAPKPDAWLYSRSTSDSAVANIVRAACNDPPLPPLGSGEQYAPLSGTYASDCSCSIASHQTASEGLELTLTFAGGVPTHGSVLVVRSQDSQAHRSRLTSSLRSLQLPR